MHRSTLAPATATQPSKDFCERRRRRHSSRQAMVMASICAEHEVLRSKGCCCPDCDCFLSICEMCTAPYESVREQLLELVLEGADLLHLPQHSFTVAHRIPSSRAEQDARLWTALCIGQAPAEVNDLPDTDR